ncbi:MAG: GAF domain-containing protein, partial [Deltaproteobacteria bacterium]|nr:GAF domain-containing protein [Deltaproteobacteria bacterium]
MTTKKLKTTGLDSLDIERIRQVAAIKSLEVQALCEIAQLVGAAAELDTALAEILRVLHDTMHMERATLFMLDATGKRLVIKASYGMTELEKKRGIYKLDEGICGRIFRSRFPFVVPDIKSEPLFLNRTQSRKGIAKDKIAFIGVPVILRDGPVGALTVDRVFESHISFEEDVQFITVVATLIAQFLELDNILKLKEELLIEENRSLKAELDQRYNRHNIIGQSKVMNEVFRLIDRVSPSAATALLLGESGTGKELVARAVHQASPRADEAFIKINCAALPENLLESELLGHEKGAFTGATSFKKGKFELADHGTFFLDEIGEMPLNLQAKLLRVLQEKQFERLGGNRTMAVDVRIIAATNVDLAAAVNNGTFRSDLYYRLNVVPIILPPLRERREDIPLLFDFFLRESNERNKRQLRLSKEIIEFLKDYSWPGNVRELQNMVERLVIMAVGDWARVSDLPSCMLAGPKQDTSADGGGSIAPACGTSAGRPAASFSDIERDLVEKSLIRNGW